MPRQADPSKGQKRNERRFFMVEKTPETTTLIAFIRRELIRDTPGATVPDSGILREGLYALIYLILSRGTSSYLTQENRNEVLAALRGDGDEKLRA